MNFVARRNYLSDILCIVHKNMTNVFSEKGQSVVNANTLFENLNTDTRNIYFESFLKSNLRTKISGGLFTSGQSLASPLVL